MYGEDGKQGLTRISPPWLAVVLGTITMVALVVSPTEAHAGIVFENVGEPLDWGGGLGLNELNSPGAQIGDQVTLDGTDRILTGAQMAVRGQVDDIALRITLRLYAQDGPEDSPGTLLYESEAIPETVHAAGSLIDFSLPSILAPDTLTWTLQFDGGAPWVIGIVNHDPVSIGSSPNHGWIKYQGEPFRKTFPAFGEGRRFVARFQAVPEPASLFLLVVWATGTVIWYGTRRRGIA